MSAEVAALIVGALVVAYNVFVAVQSRTRARGPFI